MIQEDTTQTKAFRHIVEPLRALKGISGVAQSQENECTTVP